MTTQNSATTGAADAALSFSTTPRNIMTFTTHNQAQIDINGTHLQGYVDAKYAELVSLFGKPTDGDGYKVDAEWVLRFEDGEVATIYNYKNGKNYCGDEGLAVEQIGNWHIGGNRKSVVDKVQIALDLHRESKQAKPKDKVGEAFATCSDMIETIRATKGQAYLDTVEIASLVRKRAELLAHLTDILVSSEILPKAAQKVIGHIDSRMGASIIGKYARHAGIETTEAGSKEIMDWVDRIMEYEAKGAEELLKSAEQDGNDD
jgi:hypothetical protein